MDKIKLAKNRRNLPPFKSYGHLDTYSIDKLKSFAVFAMEHLGDESHVTAGLRSISGIDLEDDFKITHYLLQSSEGIPTDSTDFTITNYGMQSIIDDLERLLDSKIYNLKLAVMNPHGTIDFHIDDPIKERFTCVIQGSQEIVVKAKKEMHAYIPKIGEVVFLNTSWPHAVYSTSDVTRLALVGCYDLAR